MATGEVSISTVSEFLIALAKAIKMVQFYPPNNPMPEKMVHNCCAKLDQLATDTLVLTVGREGFSIEENPLEMTSAGLRQLSLKLYVLGIDEITFEQGLSPAELTSACWLFGKKAEDIAALGGLPGQLLEQNISHIKLHESAAPEIIEIQDIPARALIRMITERERDLQQRLSRKQEPAGKQHRGKRTALSIGAHLDIPSIPPEELNDVINSPSQLLELLYHYTSTKETESLAWRSKPVERLEEVIGLLELADELARSEAHQSLANTILHMDKQQRDELLQDAIIPALVQGREESQLLRFFPDGELAQTLAFASREENEGALEDVAEAFTHLGLAERRQTAVLPLLEHEFAHKGISFDGTTAQEAWRVALALTSKKHIDLESSTRRQRLTTTQFGTSPTDGFSITEEDTQTLATAKEKLSAIDRNQTYLSCLVNLLSLEGNADIARGFAARIDTILREMAEEESWRKLAHWLERLGALVNLERSRRPAVSVLIREMLTELCRGDLVSNLLRYYHQADKADAREVYLDTLRALGNFAIPTYVHLLDTAQNRALRRTVLKVMLEVSQLLDPTCLAPHIKHHHWYVVRNIAWLLGRMGSGTENILLEAVDYPHRKVKTEALRSLAMVATPTSISLIFRLLSTGDRTVRRTAIEFVANLPVTILEPHLMKVLSSKEFIKRDPAVTVVLIDALARADQQGAERILGDIAGMRFILWNWKCVRVGIRAYQALRRGHHNHSPRQPAASTQRESGEQGNP